jgi:ribose-phosphate pyrophosphokinase
VDNLDAGIIGVTYFADKDLVNPVIISPDAGGVYRAKKFLEGCALLSWLSFVCVVCLSSL